MLIDLGADEIPQCEIANTWNGIDNISHEVNEILLFTKMWENKNAEFWPVANFSVHFHVNKICREKSFIKISRWLDNMRIIPPLSSMQNPRENLARR